MSYLDFEIEVEAGTDGSYPGQGYAVPGRRGTRDTAPSLRRKPAHGPAARGRAGDPALGGTPPAVVSAELTTVRGFGSALFHRAAAGGDPHCLSDQPPGGRGPRRGATGKVGSSLDRVDLRQRGRGSRSRSDRSALDVWGAGPYQRLAADPP